MKFLFTCDALIILFFSFLFLFSFQFSYKSEISDRRALFSFFFLSRGPIKTRRFFAVVYDLNEKFFLMCTYHRFFFLIFFSLVDEEREKREKENREKRLREELVVPVLINRVVVTGVWISSSLFRHR